LEPEASVRIAAIVVLTLLSLPVQAQTSNPQTACRGVYLLGEKVPPECQAARQGGLPVYRRWNEGSGTTSANPDNRRPADYGLYHFGGHNALYGLDARRDLPPLAPE
jgi:hypothetical protein